MEAALGVKVAVRPRQKGRLATGEIVWLCEDVEDGTEWLVYETAPDTKQLQYLHDQLAGRAAAKASETMVPEIHVYFGELDCDEAPEDPLAPAHSPQPRKQIEKPEEEKVVVTPPRPNLGLDLQAARSNRKE